VSQSSFDLKELKELLDLPRGCDFQSSCLHILERLVEFKSSWPFLKPVKKEEVPDYYDVIKNPMDFQTMREKVLAGEYRNREQYIEDVQLICDNARLYNTKSTIYYKSASDLEQYAKDILVNLKNQNDNASEGNFEMNYLSDWQPAEEVKKVVKGKSKGSLKDGKLRISKRLKKVKGK
jgi:histone acetyltransferase